MSSGQCQGTSLLRTDKGRCHSESSNGQLCCFGVKKHWIKAGDKISAAGKGVKPCVQCERYNQCA
ncbi:hypothetical protein CVS40_8928 [Lucilia cuprina]|nr:hypothetical protein CVS40_8928 [Lucilia cuprina]